MDYTNLVTVGGTLASKPKFASSACRFGTIGKNRLNGELYIFTDDSKIVSLSDGNSYSAVSKLADNITSLPLSTSITIVANTK